MYPGIFNGGMLIDIDIDFDVDVDVRMGGGNCNHHNTTPPHGCIMCCASK